MISHARHTPDAAVLRWWSERQCAAPLRFGVVGMYRVRADAHGIYTEGGRRVAFFLEYDRATESVPVLVDKLRRYEQLTAQGGPAWPVLFFVPDEARERQLLQHLGRGPLATPAATAVAAGLGAGRGVADAVWRPVTAPDAPLRLIDLGSLGDAADDATLYRLDRRP